MSRTIRFVSSSKTRLTLVGAVLVALATSLVAVAYFTSSGSGTGTASTGTLTAPTLTATPSAGMVAFTWSTVTPPAGSDPVSYYVTRVGGSVGGNCPSSASPTTVTGCADSGLAAGTYHYTVTAKWRSWTATSADTPATVASGAATHFLLQAATTTPTAGQGDNLTITAEDAADITVTAYTGDQSLTFGGATTIGTFHPTVTDKNGVPTIVGTPETITFTNGVAAVTPSTVNNGVMTLYKAELATITVTDGSISNTGLNVTVGAAAAATTSVASGSGQSAAVLTAFTNPLVASVQDGFGNPVPGVSVTFTAPASGASGTFANMTFTTSASTGVNGQATSTTFTANGTAGGYSVGATTPGAPTANFSLTNTKGSQTVSFTSSNPSPVTVGGATYIPTATASSGLAVAVTLDGTSTGCSLSAGVVSFTAVGTCKVDANQSGDANYNAALQAQQSITVAKGNQTITFSALANKTFDQGPITVSATASSGLAVSYISTTLSICTVGASSGVVTFVAVGSCSITAGQAGDSNWNAATQVSQSFTISKGNQTITFTSSNPSPVTVGGATYTPTATSPAGLTVAIALDGTSTGCSLSAGVVSFTAVGTCKLDANQGGSTNYNAATQVQQSITVNKGSQTVSFTSSNPSPVTVGGATYIPTATASSGLAVAVTLDGTSTGCSLSAGVVSFTAVGTCKVDANQSGDANYNAALQAQQSITVAKGNQTITFSALANKTFDQGPITVSATASSGLAVSYISTTLSICTVGASSGVVTFVAVGSCSITAGQAGDSNWNAATQVSQSFTISKGNQTITFTSSNPSPVTVGGATYTPTATSPAGLTVAIALDGTSTGCSLSAGVVSFTAVGTCKVDANQGGSTNYNAATQVQQSITVNKGSQTVSFTSTPPAHGKVATTYLVSATGGASGNAVTFSIDATTSTVCSIVGSTVTFTTLGTCKVDANQAGNGNYNAALQAQQSITVDTQGDQTITFTSTAPAGFVGGPQYMPTATGGGSGNAVTFTVDATSTSICSISAGAVTFNAAGTCRIDANQLGNGNWNAAPQVQQSVTVVASTTKSESSAGTYTLTLPAHQTQVVFALAGAGGAGGNTGAAGSAGGSVTGTITVPDSASSTVLTVVVGGMGNGGKNAAGGTGGLGGVGCAAGGTGGGTGSSSDKAGGGGGGGATCVYVSGASTSVIVVVGGGGGGGGGATTGLGGAGGGGPTTNPGTNAGTNGTTAGTDIFGAGGSTSTLGSFPFTIGSNTGGSGGTGTSAGSTGGTCIAGTCSAGGDGGAGGSTGGGGGGGGGYASGGGGGGGAAGQGAGGGGGSSYTGGTTGMSVAVTSASNGGGSAGGAAGANSGTDGTATFTGVGITLA